MECQQLSKQQQNQPQSATRTVDIEACLKGETGAWASLVDTYGQSIRKAVFWTLRHSREKFAFSGRSEGGAATSDRVRWEKFADPAEVEDIVQEVYFRLLRGEYKLLKTYDPKRSSFATWICVVARSAALDHMRNRRNGAHASLDEVDEAEVLGVWEEWDTPVCSIPMGLLTPRQMSVVHLCYEKDMDVSEMAQVMDVHPNTVRSIRHSALVRLREYHRGARATA